MNNHPIKVALPLLNKVRKLRDKKENHGAEMKYKYFKKLLTRMLSSIISDCKNYQMN